MFSRVELKTLSPSIKDYYGSFGMPSFVIALVTASRETIVVEQPGDGQFSIKTVTGELQTELVVYVSDLCFE